MKIAIVGTGRMGSWLAQLLAQKHRVTVFDIDPDQLAIFREDSRVEIISGLDGLQEFMPDMLINAVSLQHTISAFKEAEPYLPKECILCDIASIKGDIPAYYQETGRPFVSVHPMFGPTFTELNSLKEENAVIITESDQEGIRFFRELFAQLGLTVYEYTAAYHDEMMAYSLSLPFVSSMVFAACMKEKAVPGSTFARHMNIARGLMSEDNKLLSEILFNKYTLTQLEKVTSRLEFLKHVIRAKDHEEAERFYDGLRENIR